MFTQLSNAGGHAEHCKDTVRPFIPRLFSRSFPTAVILFIIAISILASKRSSIWPLAHVFEKGLKIAPLGTECNSPAAVVLKEGFIRIAATHDHFAPTLVSPCQMIHSGMSMFEEKTIHHGFSSTAARCLQCGSQCAEVNRLYGSAFAQADNEMSFEAFWITSGRRFLDHFKFAEDHSDGVYSWWHNGNFIFASGTRPTLIGVCCDSAENLVWTEG